MNVLLANTVLLKQLVASLPVSNWTLCHTSCVFIAVFICIYTRIQVVVSIQDTHWQSSNKAILLLCLCVKTKTS